MLAADLYSEASNATESSHKNKQRNNAMHILRAFVILPILSSVVSQLLSPQADCLNEVIRKSEGGL